MAKLGDISRGNSLGYVSNARHIWLACENCGKERWILLKKDKRRPDRNLCYPCANQIKRGGNHPNWKGGRSLTNAGYVSLIIQSDDPFYCMASKRGEILEHRYVMAKYMGRPLESWEIVDHRNDPKSDNRIENLDLVTLHENLQLQKMRIENERLMARVDTLEARLTILEAEQVISATKFIIR